MTTLTLRLPDAAHENLRQIARQQKVSLNRLFENMAEQLILSHQMENEFRLRAARGTAFRQEALCMLDQMDARHQTQE